MVTLFFKQTRYALRRYLFFVCRATSGNDCQTLLKYWRTSWKKKIFSDSFKCSKFRSNILFVYFLLYTVNIFAQHLRMPRKMLA